jgi:DNA repair exonuclease SbcCD ATPase subunit
MRLLTHMMVFLFLATISMRCGTKKENEALKAELEKVKKENEGYKAKTVEMNVSIEGYKKVLAEIDSNLRSIDENATMTSSLKGDLKSGASVADKILNRIRTIHSLMENSKLKIQALDRTLNDLRKKYGAKSEEVLQLNRELKEAAALLIEKEKDFNAMKADMESDMEGLESAYKEQLKIAEELRDILNRAFFYAGTKKELESKGIVESEGGFIGIGRVKVLNANSPEALFNKIAKDMTDSLVFKSKTLKLITEHPGESYKIKETKTQSVLTIVDKNAFWKQSNYLVVQTAGQ